MSRPVQYVCPPVFPACLAGCVGPSWGKGQESVMYHPERAHWQPLMMDGLIMECFLHIHNLHHTEQWGLAGLPYTYMLPAGHVRSQIHCHTYTHVRLAKWIDKKGSGNTKRKGANLLATALSCMINTADQSFIKKRMAFAHIPTQTFVVPGHMMTCQIRFPAVYLAVRFTHLSALWGWTSLHLWAGSLLSISTLHCPCSNT